MTNTNLETVTVFFEHVGKNPLTREGRFTFTDGLPTLDFRRENERAVYAPELDRIVCGGFCTIDLVNPNTVVSIGNGSSSLFIVRDGEPGVETITLTLETRADIK